MKTGIELIAQERKEQIEKHGRTIDLDIKHNNRGQLSDAVVGLLNKSLSDMPEEWDDKICDKMVSKSYKFRLIIAGALIAAELDRITNDPHWAD